MKYKIIKNEAFDAKKKASQFYWDAFNTQMKPELRYCFRLG